MAHLGVGVAGAEGAGVLLLLVDLRLASICRERERE